VEKIDRDYLFWGRLGEMWPVTTFLKP